MPQIKDDAKLEPTRLDVMNGDRPTSFSGADFVVLAYRPQLLDSNNQPITEPETGEKSLGRFVEFANIQTLSISTTRDIAAERPLGTSWVREYSRGARTVAGSLVFTVFDGDALATLQGVRPGSSREDANAYSADNIPEFNIVVSATNEYGQTVAGVLLGICITNGGLTIGTQDVYTEQVYSYVARQFVPLKGAMDMRKSLSDFLLENKELREAIVAQYDAVEWVPAILEPISEAEERYRHRRNKQIREAQRAAREIIRTDPSRAGEFAHLFRLP